MLRFVVRRLLWAVPTLLAVTFVVYVTIRLSTNPVVTYGRANPRASPEQIRDYIERNGLWSGWRGYLRGYVDWLGNFLGGPGRWSPSVKGNREVWPRLRDALLNSVRLGGVSIVLGVLVGTGLGVVAALRPGGLRDGVINTGTFVAMSIPTFVAALLLQLLFSVSWSRWFGAPLLPVAGVYPPGQQGFDLAAMVRHMVLPVTVVVIQIVGVYSRYVRASLLDVLASPAMLAARAKGISERQVLVRHALRNALVPVVTIAAIDAGAIFSGLIITERIFSYPGMGDYFLTAYGNGDFSELMPWMVVVVLGVVLFNLLADLSYAWLDPRVRHV